MTDKINEEAKEMNDRDELLNKMQVDITYSLNQYNKKPFNLVISALLSVAIQAVVSNVPKESVPEYYKSMCDMMQKTLEQAEIEIKN